MKQPFKLLLLPLSLLLPLLLACGKPDQQAAKDQTEARIPVRVARVAERRVTSILRLTGEVAPLWKLDVYSDAAGKIIEKRAQLGERVGRGQVLARLRQEIPGMEYSPVAIEAPAAGLILGDMVEEGAMVTPQRPVYTLAGVESVLVQARVLESDWNKLRPGAACALTAAAVPGRRFNGRVRRLWPQVDARSRTAGAEIIVANAEQLLRPGMSAECEFATGSRLALLAPLDALIRSGAGYRAARISGGRARFTTLSAGEIVAGEIVVSGGIAAGDTVVVYGQNLLQEGAAVTVVE